MRKISKLWVVLAICLGGSASFLMERLDAKAEAHRDKRNDSGANRRGQATPTFNKEIVRIFQNNCQTCHHAGDIAPFSLMTYREARPWAAAIREAVLLKKMPPWKPVLGCGDLRDARILDQPAIDAIVAWVDGGAPEGSAADLPTPLDFPDGWALGAPDLVLKPEIEYTPPISEDQYRCFSIPAGDLRGDRWIGAMAVKPGNASIVHHVIAYADPDGKSIALDEQDPGLGYTCFGGPGFPINANDISNGGYPLIGGWAPGSRGYFAPEGTGIKLRNNSRVVMQVHYHPNGRPETDRTQLGVYYAKSPVERQLQVLPLVNQSFTIPPGEKNYEVTADFTIPSFISAKLWTVTPHMHLLGRKIKVELTRPGVTTPDCLIRIDDWNFNWQGSYIYNQAVPSPGGSLVKMTAVYDNSTENLLNPNSPPKPVHWGEQTTDEMALAFMGFTLDSFRLPTSTPLLSEALIDSQERLVTSGTGFLAGADIEINGRSLHDTQTEGGKLASSEFWKVYAAPGQTVDVAVLNPDGVRTPVIKFTRPGAARSLGATSAASFSADALAPDSIATIFGTGLATTSASALTSPLPTELAGTRVRVNGILAPLFFVSPEQINFLIPTNALTGSAVIEATSGDRTISRGLATLSSYAPAIFTANSAGSGAPAAVATKDGLSYFAIGNPDGSVNAVAPGDFLVLFGSGLRRASINAVKITIGGVPAPVLFSGAQGGFTGLDQINTRTPEGLSGPQDLVLSINGKPANTVRILIR